MNRPLLSGLLALLLMTAAWAQDAGRQITVTGRAIGSSEAAAEEATLDALREAVRRVCGAFINAQSEVEDFALVRDKILEQPVGFARVIKTRKGPEVVADGQITEVQILAEVFPARFEKRWAEFAHIKQREGNPRVVVTMLEDPDPDDGKPAEANGRVQSIIEDFFLSRDIQLMDKATADAVRSRDLELAARLNDNAKAAAVGAAFKADLVVMGKAEAGKPDPVEIGGHTVYRWPVTLTVRVVQTDSARVIVSKTYQPQRPLSSSSSPRTALVKLAEQVSEDLLLDIGQAWRERATVGKTIPLRLEPCSRAQFKAIQEKMIELKGITGGRDGFQLRELINGVADVEVQWKYDLSQLADRLEQLSIEQASQRLTLEVTEQTANRLTVRIHTTLPATRPVSEPAS